MGSSWPESSLPGGRWGHGWAAAFSRRDTGWGCPEKGLPCGRMSPVVVAQSWSLVHVGMAGAQLGVTEGAWGVGLWGLSASRLPILSPLGH